MPEVDFASFAEDVSAENIEKAVTDREVGWDAMSDDEKKEKAEEYLKELDTVWSNVEGFANMVENQIPKSKVLGHNMACIPYEDAFDLMQKMGYNPKREDFDVEDEKDRYRIRLWFKHRLYGIGWNTKMGKKKRKEMIKDLKSKSLQKRGKDRDKFCFNLDNIVKEPLPDDIPKPVAAQLRFKQKQQASRLEDIYDEEKTTRLNKIAEALDDVEQADIESFARKLR